MANASSRPRTQVIIALNQNLRIIRGARLSSILLLLKRQTERMILHLHHILDSRGRQEDESYQLARSNTSHLGLLLRR